MHRRGGDGRRVKHANRACLDHRLNDRNATYHDSLASLGAHQSLGLLHRLGREKAATVVVAVAKATLGALETVSLAAVRRSRSRPWCLCVTSVKTARHFRARGWSRHRPLVARKRWRQRPLPKIVPASSLPTAYKRARPRHVSPERRDLQDNVYQQQ